MKTVHHLLWRVYSSLLRLYPNAFRHCFAAEMENVFAERLAEMTQKGGAALIGFALHEAGGLCLNLVQQHWLAFQQWLNPGESGQWFDIATTPGIVPATHPNGQWLAAWLHGRSYWFVRAVEFVVATFSICLCLPLLALLALLIKIDSSGPVLFCQCRVGKGGRLFYLYKFRSMYADLATVSQERCITRIGRFMRQHNLDELPQLFNLLKGEMSLVGVRPSRAE